MANIERRGDYQWRALIRKQGFPTQSRTFTNRRDAETWARQVEAELDRGLFMPRRDAERTTFNDLAKRFAEEYAPIHYRGAGWKHKLARLQARLGKYAIAAITTTVVTEYRDARLADPDPRYTDSASAPRVSGATVKTELDLLSKCLDVASKEFGINLPNGNPCRLIRKPKDGAHRERRLNSDEATRLMAECTASQNPWLRPSVLLAVETAMRQGELLALRWQDVDLQGRIATLSMTKNGEARTIPLTSAAIEILQGLPRDIKGGPVLPVKQKTLQSAFRLACERAEITGLRFHDLRHESLSRLAERGDLSVFELASISGHKTLQMLKRYTHVEVKKLAAKLG